MISGANITPHKARINATEQVRENLEDAAYNYQQEPCAYNLEELQEVLNRAETVAEHIDWKKFVLRTYKIKLQ